VESRERSLNILPELAEHLWHGTLGGDLRTKSETHHHHTHWSARQHAILLLLLLHLLGIVVFLTLMVYDMTMVSPVVKVTIK